MKLIFSILKNLPICRWVYYSIMYTYWHFKYKNTKLDFGCVIKESTLKDNSRLSKGSKLNKTTIGKFSYVGENTIASRAKIGNFTSIGPNVTINLGNHPIFLKSTHPAFYSKSLRAKKTLSKKNSFVEYEDVIIGNDVWIGANVIILGGSKIPDGVVISAGSIVRKSDKLIPFGIYSGLKLTLLKKRKYADSHINTDNWWDLDEKILLERIDEFEKIY